MWLRPQQLLFNRKKNPLGLTRTEGGAQLAPPCLFPRTALTAANSMVPSRRNSLSHSEVKVLARLSFSKGSEGESVLCLFPSFWWLLIILGIPQLVGTGLQSLPPSLRGFLPPVFSHGLLKRTPVVGFRAHYNPLWLPINLTNYICKDHISK